VNGTPHGLVGLVCGVVGRLLVMHGSFPPMVLAFTRFIYIFLLAKRAFFFDFLSIKIPYSRVI
jgi:hypothetical protein